ncbi:MAG: peptidoglycan DD-metalloendopeptidase family protein [Actinomycetota bacterium]
MAPTSPVFLRVAGVLAACLLIASLAQPGDAAPSLQEARNNLERARQEAQQLSNQIANQRARLSQLNGEIAGLQAEIARTQADLQLILTEIGRIQNEQALTQKEYDGVQDQLNTRTRSTYMRGPGSGVEFVLGADSMLDLTERMEFIDQMTQADLDLSTELENIATKLDDDEAVQQKLKKQQQEILAYQQTRQADLLAKQSAAQTLVADLGNAVARAHALTKRWGKRVAIEERQAAQTSSAVVVGGPGPFYACPVPNHSWIANDFGAPRVGHTHQGNDIGAPYGAEIVAPFDGSASNASNGLGGLSVYVHGSQGYVYNAHLSRLGQLGHVNAGDVIGYVGTSGNAAGTSPHDHFEWHPGGGSAVDPYPYLQEVC